MSSTSSNDHAFAGKTIARCTVGERLGRGRTSHVFKAHYEPLQRDVALKILHGDMANEDEIRASFLKEARVIARLDHAHIVKVLDVAEDQGCLCILMEYVAGETLQDRLDDGGPLPPKKAARIAAEMASALAAAHEEKVLHRDIKPANVILTKGGDAVKVVDFGLAGSSKLANRAGTPLYMSPEACQGKRVDEKTDVYALGVCLYQMLTGELPFTGDSVKEILKGHIDGSLTPPSEVKPDLGTEFDGLLKKLLVKSKGYRPTAAEALELLEPHFKDDLSGTKPDRRGGGRRGGARRGAARASRVAKKKDPMPMIIAVVVILAVIGGAVAFIAGRGGSEDTSGETGTTANTGTSQPVTTNTTTSAPPQEDPIQVEFTKLLEWVDIHPADREGQIERYKKFEAAHPGTPWAKKAETRRQMAEQELRSEAAEKARKEKDAAEAAKAKQARDALNGFAANFAFGAAATAAESQRNLPDEPFQRWESRKRRLQFLADNLASTINEGLGGNPIPLNKIVVTAPAPREITKVSDAGLEWTDGSLNGTLAWKELKGKPDAVFGLAKRVVSQSDWNGNLFLAVLAAELWFDEGEAHKQSKMFREMVQLTDDVNGTGQRELDRLFEKP